MTDPQPTSPMGNITKRTRLAWVSARQAGSTPADKTPRAPLSRKQRKKAEWEAERGRILDDNLQKIEDYIRRKQAKQRVNSSDSATSWERAHQQKRTPSDNWMEIAFDTTEELEEVRMPDRLAELESSIARKEHQQVNSAESCERAVNQFHVLHYHLKTRSGHSSPNDPLITRLEERVIKN